MNLIQVQDRLNKLPPLPQSIQYLTVAAQGGNPEVPPFMALARISEINKEMQSAQQVQPPAEPLNQSLPKQAMQSMGISALQQGRQTQGMQQMAQQAGAAQQVAPPGIPQPVRQQTPEDAQSVRMAANGGLMSLPVDPRMFEYGSGGVVAFNGEDGDQEVEEDDDGEEAAGSYTPSGASKYNAVAELAKLQPQFAAQMAQGVRPVRSRAQIEAELAAKKDYGIDEGPIGKGYLEGLASLKEAKAAERAQQQKDIDARKRLASYKGLLDYSDASRGQTGLGGIGALGRNYISSTERFMGEESELRQAGIKVDELLNEAQYKVQALREAQKNGDIKAEQKADIDLAKIAKDLGVSKNNLIGKAISGNLGVIGKQIMADATVEAAAKRAAGKGAGAVKKTDLDKAYETELAALIADGEPDDAFTRKKAMNLAQRNLSKSAGSERVDVSKVKEANAEFANRMLMARELKKLRKSDPIAYQAGVDKLKKQVETEFGIKPTLTDYDANTAPAPARTPAAAPAPTAGRITPEAFNAQWSKLKPGQKLVGPDGVEYTKK